MRKLLILCLFCLGIGFAISNFTGLATRGEFDSLVIDFKDNLPVGEIDRELAVLSKEYHVAPHLNSRFSQAEHLYVVKGDRSLLTKLQASSLSKDIESIEPNYIYHKYSKQWHLRSIHIEQAWEENRGKGITVAIIDTGVSKVPDLEQTEFVKGYDFVNDKVNADDDNGHGTHVAGTVAQSTNNNYGVAGIAYEAKIMPLKVLSGSGGGTISDIAEAIRFAADNKANIINMSLGGGGESQVMKDAIDYAHKKGVHPIPLDTLTLSVSAHSTRKMSEPNFPTTVQG
jgi:serine protease